MRIVCYCAITRNIIFGKISQRIEISCTSQGLFFIDICIYNLFHPCALVKKKVKVAFI